MHAALVVLHVVGAVFLVGPMAILPMTALRALRSGDGEQVVGLTRSVLVFSWLSLLVVVFGFGVLGTSEGTLSIGTTWIWLSLLLYLVALALSVGVVVPALRAGSRHLQGAGSAGSTGSTGSRADYSRIAASSGTVSLLLLVVVVLMVLQP